MELEFHQLDLRYERLRVCRPAVERRLLASLAEVGQQVPILVVSSADADRFVLVDGYKRVRALRRLHADTARATAWDLSEAEALLVDRLMRSGDGETAIEQGWLLDELVLRFELTLEELARRFGRSVSWVSRRLALVHELPEPVQDQVRRGDLLAHAAQKYLVPLARANGSACLRLVAGIAGKGLSSRQVGTLYAAWRDGTETTRERLLGEPLLFLRAREQLASSSEPDTLRALLDAFDTIGAVARRADRRLAEGAFRRLLAPERVEAARCLTEAHQAVERVCQRVRWEMTDAGPGNTGGNPAACSARAQRTPDRERAEGLASERA